jgi:biotin operon repressor
MYYERSYRIEKRFEKAVKLLNSGRISAKDFAKGLEVSTATASRIIKELRRRGFQIETVHTANGWIYQTTILMNLKTKQSILRL